MTSKQEVFSKLVKCDNEIITLGDDNVHEVQGIDEVHTKVPKYCIETCKMSFMLLV